MRAIRRIAAVFVLLCAVSVPSHAILFTCDDICDCNMSCALACKNGVGIRITCGQYGVCIGKPGCESAVATAPVSTSAPLQCTVNETAAQPAFLAPAPAQP